MEITVVIPIFNRGDIFKPTFDSVVAQSHRPIHLVLVDNNSTDNTLEVLQQLKVKNESDDFKITVLTESVKGASAARNRGLGVTKTEWMLFFDSDDLMHPSLLSRYAELANDGVDMVISRNTRRELSGEVTELPFYQHNLLVNHLSHSVLRTNAYMLRTDLARVVGGWNVELPSWNDWEFGTRLLLQSPKLAFITDMPLVDMIAQRESITGVGYSDRSECWERSLDAVVADVQQSNYKDKRRVLLLLEFVRIRLAGIYSSEGSEKGRTLYQETIKQCQANAVMKCIFRCSYHYVARGGRGVTHPIKFLISYF
ncbi:MAG: glycosyltransferase family A protein [Bacteroidales bacterium]